MAIRCFYHAADLDGHCSGAIVKYRFPEAVMYPINYGDEFPWGEIRPDDEVYMVDFCMQPFEDMIRLASMCELHWIDHHKSAIDEFHKYLKFIPLHYDKNEFYETELSTSMAACELTWEYLFPDRLVPLAVKLLSLYDSWTYQGHELEDMVLPFQMRMRMEDLDPHNKHSDHAIANWTDFFEEPTHLNIIKLIAEGRLLLRYDDANKAKYAETYAFETTLVSPDYYRNGSGFVYRAIAVNLGHTNSKVFDSVWRIECGVCNGSGNEQETEVGYLGKECHLRKGDGYIEPYDLMITFVRRKDKLWNVSLYSTKPDVDCGAIAKSFGGGGHKGAAGFQCDELPFEY